MRRLPLTYMKSGQGAGPSAGSDRFAPSIWFDQSGGVDVLTLPQFHPAVNQCDPTRVQGPYAGGILVGLGDGSVRLVNSGVGNPTWRTPFTLATVCRSVRIGESEAGGHYKPEARAKVSNSSFARRSGL